MGKGRQVPIREWIKLICYCSKPHPLSQLLTGLHVCVVRLGICQTAIIYSRDTFSPCPRLFFFFFFCHSYCRHNSYGILLVFQFRTEMHLELHTPLETPEISEQCFCVPLQFLALFSMISVFSFNRFLDHLGFTVNYIPQGLFMLFLKC